MKKLKYLLLPFKLRRFIIFCLIEPGILYEFMRSKGGHLKLNNGTYIVHQSKAFYDYCYNVAYKEFKKQNE